VRTNIGAEESSLDSFGIHHQEEIERKRKKERKEKKNMVTTATDVIDWDEAMQQCGEDEEFLRELLDDLRTEMNSQLIAMDEAIRNPPANNIPKACTVICRAAHVIKGAASNLMCGQLRETATALESSASAANHNPTLLVDVKEKFEELKVAVDAYHAHLGTIGV